MSSSLKVGAILGSLLVLCLWYVPYYIQHSNLYEKHLFVLRTECVDGKLHPMIQHNVMTYDGVPTNCSHAQVVTSIPVLGRGLYSTPCSTPPPGRCSWPTSSSRRPSSSGSSTPGPSTAPPSQYSTHSREPTASWPLSSRNPSKNPCQFPLHSTALFVLHR